jgi:hypothetical protein
VLILVRVGFSLPIGNWTLDAGKRDKRQDTRHKSVDFSEGGLQPTFRSWKLEAGKKQETRTKRQEPRVPYLVRVD